jgi:hypothetical protein
MAPMVVQLLQQATYEVCHVAMEHLKLARSNDKARPE